VSHLTSGLYQCEVSGDGPRSTTNRKKIISDLKVPSGQDGST
jgi:hypothetical protein